MFKLVIGNKNYSSWSLRAWLVARHSGLAFEEHRLALNTPEFYREIRHYSEASKVPVLIADGEPIWDSLAIAEFLAEKNPALWPEAPMARAQARSISAEMHSGFSALRQCLPMNCRAQGRQVAVSTALAADIERVDHLWQGCLAKQPKGSGLFGRWCIADAMFAPVVFRFLTYDIKLSEPSTRYVQWQMADPHMQDWLEAACNETETIAGEEVGVSG